MLLFWKLYKAFIRYDNCTVCSTVSSCSVSIYSWLKSRHIIPHRGFVVHGDEVILAGVLHKLASILPVVLSLVRKSASRNRTFSELKIKVHHRWLSDPLQFITEQVQFVRINLLYISKGHKAMNIYNKPPTLTKWLINIFQP